MTTSQQTIVPNGPVQFSSFAELEVFAKLNGPPMISDDPCPCGNARIQGHRYCDECAKAKRRASRNRRQRKWRSKRLAVGAYAK